MRKLVLSIAAIFLLTTFASADDIVRLSDRFSPLPNDFYDWSQFGGPGTSVPSSSLITSVVNGSNALVGSLSGDDLQRHDEGTDWTGNFAVDDPLLSFTQGAYMIFEQPLTFFGLQVQSADSGPFVAELLAFDPSFNQLYDGFWYGNSNTAEDGSALFLGLGDLDGANIGAFALVTSGNAFDSAFAINYVTTGTTPVVPEPGTLMLMGSGILAAAGAARRKLALA